MSVASSNISGGNMGGNWTHVTQSWTRDLPSVLLFDEHASNLQPTILIGKQVPKKNNDKKDLKKPDAWKWVLVLDDFLDVPPGRWLIAVSAASCIHRKWSEQRLSQKWIRYSTLKRSPQKKKKKYICGTTTNNPSCSTFSSVLQDLGQNVRIYIII